MEIIQIVLDKKLLLATDRKPEALVMLKRAYRIAHMSGNQATLPLAERLMNSVVRSTLKDRQMEDVNPNAL